MDEGYLMEHIKEQLCFVSQDPGADLAASKGQASKHRRLYILPDGVTSKTGHVYDPEAGEALPPQKDAVRAEGRGVGTCEASIACEVLLLLDRRRLHTRCLACIGTHSRPTRHHNVDTSQVLVVNNERFMVPEAIFHPSGGCTPRSAAQHALFPGWQQTSG